MLLTEELEDYIYSEVQPRLGNIVCNNLFFLEGTESSAEGTYIFNKDNEYHILVAEKGKIRSDIVTCDKKEVLWNALELFSTELILDYAIRNRKEGVDFRRAFFTKEIEIYALFGEEFKKRKIDEIAEILKRNPYNDNMGEIV